jgi:hypothetical protein
MWLAAALYVILKSVEFSKMMRIVSAFGLVLSFSWF